MELQKLKEKDALEREKTLTFLLEQRYFLVADFDCDFSMHEIKGKSDIAIHPVEAPNPDDYFRCYVLPVATDDSPGGPDRLIIDELLLDVDEVDFTQEIYWSLEAKGWRTREKRF